MDFKPLPNIWVIDDRGPAASGRRSYARRPTFQARLQVILNWLERNRQRRRLADLEPWLLEDIGVSRVQAAAEAAKPFWRD